MINDPEPRRWFDDSTQFAGRPSYAAMLTALHEPVAVASLPLVGDSKDGVKRMTAARNGLAHALEQRFGSNGDFQYDYYLAAVSHAVLVARLLLELGYTPAQIRRHFIEMPELRGLAEVWWRLTQTSEARPSP